jgi:hypothetical protein
MSRNKSLPTLFTASWRSSKQIMKSQLFTWKAFRTALVFSLLAGLALSFTSRPSLTTTAQEQNSNRVSEASSLPEALAAGMTEQPVSIAQIDSSAEAPDGGACSWANSTVYPRTILDQATVTLGGNIYTFGGVSTAIIADANKFDGTTWTPIASLPQPLEFPAAVTNGTDIFVLGGASSAGTPQTTLYR